MPRAGLIASARRYAAQNNGVHGLSFWSWPGLTAGQIAMRVKGMHQTGKNPLPHGQLRQSTVARLTEPSGDGRVFGLGEARPDGHCTLTFPSEPTEADWDRIDEMFDEPEPNPAAD